MAGDPLSGTWTTGQQFMRLRYDGQRAVFGAVTSGAPTNMVPIKSGSFDAATGALRIEGVAPHPNGGAETQFLIEGTLSGNYLDVTFQFGEFSGSTTFTRHNAARVFRAGLTAVRHRVERLVQMLVMPVMRAAKPRRTKEQNEVLMRERGETPSAFVVRDVRPDELDALARLHVVTWAATYPEVLRPPTFAIRQWQWREAFVKQDGSWFCHVVENAKGELVGFAKGVRMRDGNGDLNKIYLLSEYQRLGLGRRMLAAVTDRFLAMGVTRMFVNAEADNPSCAFYRATGAVNTVDERTGRPNAGSFVWNDLAKLVAGVNDKH